MKGIQDDLKVTGWTTERIKLSFTYVGKIGKSILFWKEDQELSLPGSIKLEMPLGIQEEMLRR